MNQPVLNKEISPLAIMKKKAMVKKSKIELIPPKKVVNLLISRIFQFFGAKSSSLSILSVDIDSKGPSLIRLVNRT